MVLLDTHIWLWWLLGDGNLKVSEREALDSLASKRSLTISWVTIWETEMLERKGRIKLRPDINTWMKLATKPGVCSILPVDLEVVLKQRDLPESFHNDPADRLIASTAMLSGYPLATMDKKIKNSGVCKIWNS
ncbi:MAG: type II toxin-antitoxin system VapC family toxin [Balneolaceae bacterium]